MGSPAFPPSAASHTARQWRRPRSRRRSRRRRQQRGRAEFCPPFTSLLSSSPQRGLGLAGKGGGEGGGGRRLRQRHLGGGQAAGGTGKVGAERPGGRRGRTAAMAAPKASVASGAAAASGAGGTNLLFSSSATEFNFTVPFIPVSQAPAPPPPSSAASGPGLLPAGKEKKREMGRGFNGERGRERDLLMVFFPGQDTCP